jgi:hypothetical protein
MFRSPRHRRVTVGAEFYCVGWRGADNLGFGMKLIARLLT